MTPPWKQTFPAKKCCLILNLPIYVHYKNSHQHQETLCCTLCEKTFTRKFKLLAVVVHHQLNELERQFACVKDQAERYFLMMKELENLREGGKILFVTNKNRKQIMWSETNDLYSICTINWQLTITCAIPILWLLLLFQYVQCVCRDPSYLVTGLRVLRIVNPPVD